MGFIGSGLGIAVFLLVFIIFKWINILNEYERGVIFRLGRVLKDAKGPGLVIVMWPIDRMVKISLRTVVHDIPPQDVITRDNVSVKVNAVVYFRVMNPVKSVVEVENYIYATSQLAQTTLRAVLGEVDLDDLLSKREAVNVRLQTIIDEHSDPWGVKVSMVEVKHVDLPQEMQRAIAKQDEAEREKRAKIIHADGEFVASQKLAQAADVMAANPITIFFFNDTATTEIYTENASTIVFPVPLRMLEALIK
jgi:regulator of protease activity HflC (stomatin/prohibitin superfamily)